ncbi:MAG: MFS transporter [Clostridia bacterium]|nr:MFS transporter [Clostridia bacterium]
MQKDSLKLTSLEKKWVMYDVGNSAFVLFASTIIPIYFNSLVGNDSTGLATTIWGAVSSIVALLSLFICPIFGTMADFKGKRTFFLLFALTGIICCALLSLPILGAVAFAIIYVLTETSLSSSCVFYDSMLSDVTTEDRLHNVSANGYAWGYIGSCIPFALCLVLVLVVPDAVMSMQWRMTLSFLLTAAWWLCFTLPLFKSYQQKHFLPRPPHAIRNTFVRLGQIFKEIKKNKKAFLFLVAFFLYINGAYTIIKMATIYGQDMLHFGTTELLLALLVTQIVAFPSAIIIGRLSKKIEDKYLIFICIGGYVAVSLFALFLKFSWQFWVLAVCVGLFQGGIQAMSRSYFTSIIPAEKSGEFFGIYDIFGKGAGTLGPALVSLFVFIVSEITKAFPAFTAVTAVMNLDLLPIPLLTIAGLIVFFFTAKMPTTRGGDESQKTE